MKGAKASEQTRSIVTDRERDDYVCEVRATEYTIGIRTPKVLMTMVFSL